MKRVSWLICIAVTLVSPAAAEQPYQAPRCEVVPQADFQTSLRIDGVEPVRWHFGTEYPGPFFYPLQSPRGGVLTRMGHPGAPNHDHHRSVWFGHHDVGGLDFWAMGSPNQIRQKSWSAYEDGDDECVLASELGWYDAAGREVLQQEMIAALRPAEGGAHALEIQITFRPTEGDTSVELGKTNFGFFAVRVAKSVSAHFGNGRLTNSEGQQGEPAIFGLPARWVDYSGPVTVGTGAERSSEVEGITYFDHPSNPRYPTPWHVRADGWMAAAFCLDEAYTIQADRPLMLRYLLLAHGGPYDAAMAERVHQEFAGRPSFVVEKSSRPHRQYEVARQLPERD